MAAGLPSLCGCTTAFKVVGRCCHHVSWMASRFIPTRRTQLGAHRPSMRALCSLVVLLLTSTPGHAQHNAPAIPPVDPHHHVVPVHQAPWTTELAPDARL